MSVEITEAQRRTYSEGFTHVMQQSKTLLEGTAAKTQTGNTGKAVSFDRIGKAVSRKRTSRHSDTYNSDTPHSRRWAVPSTYDWGDLIDEPDKIRTLTDPQGDYIQAGKGALNRDKDDVIISALRGTAISGEEATTSVTLPTGQKVSVAASGLTPTKIKTALEKLNLADADPDEPKIFIIGPKQVTNLLDEQELTSGDYVTLKPLMDGKVVRWCGFDFIMSNRLYTASSVRYCLAYLKNRAFGYAKGQDITSWAMMRADKSGSVQCFASMDLGAVRLQEEAVIEVACLES
jgi:hypothetical protein